MREKAIYLPLTASEKQALVRQAKENEMNQRQYLRTLIREMDKAKGK